MSSFGSLPGSMAWQPRTSAKSYLKRSIAAPGHYSPEQIYAVVRRRIPSVSLATIYKNLRLFVENGLLREVSPHAATLRVDGNLESHHHLVCTRCKSVQDIAGDFVDFKRLARQAPGGFDLRQPLIEVFGLCPSCSKTLIEEKE